MRTSGKVGMKVRWLKYRKSSSLVVLCMPVMCAEQKWDGHTKDGAVSQT